jgi:hypothetical protein
MRPLLFVLLVFTMITASYGQDSSKPRPPFAVYIMPAQLINLSYSLGFTVGTEFRAYRNFSLTIEGGCFYTPGFMAKANVKYYLLQRTDHVNRKERAYYFALEYAYKEQSYNVRDELREPPKTRLDYSVDKYVSTANIKFGKTLSRLHSWYIDLYFGAGIRYRIVHNSLLPGEKETLYHWNEGQVDGLTNDKAKNYLPNISLGVKLGYRYK